MVESFEAGRYEEVKDENVESESQAPTKKKEEK